MNGSEVEVRGVLPATGRPGRWPKWAGALAAAWLGIAAPVPSAFADPNPSNDQGQMELRFRLRDVFPPAPVTNLQGFPGAEGQALLQWTAPQESFGLAPKTVPVVSYDLRFATFSIAALAGDTTAWFNVASPLDTPIPLVPGSDQAVLTSLEAGVTYYFGLRSTDDSGNVSDIDANARLAGTQARVPVRGIRSVTDLRAAPGPDLGSIRLTWTQPSRLGQLDPLAYEIRVSSVADITSNAEFAAALPVAAFSPTPVPAVGAADSLGGMTVTGLTPGIGYYFAIRAIDAGSPAFKGRWRRDPAAGVNEFNFSTATFIATPPAPITDLVAGFGSAVGQARLSWTVPPVPGGAPVKRYLLKVNTLSVENLFGDAEGWFSLVTSTTMVVNSTATAGERLTVAMNGLPTGTTLYFGVKSEDILDQRSAIDTPAASGVNQARLVLGRPIELKAAPGAASGSIDLSWNEPFTEGLAAPTRYVLKASSAANLDDDAAFDAAPPLSAVTASVPPAPGGTGAPITFTVTGLSPTVVYYFAIKLEDSAVPPSKTPWRRSAGEGLNQENFAAARYIPNPADPITDLTALAGAVEGQVRLSWTAPRNQNFVAVSSYTVRLSTVSPAAFGGDGSAWFDLASDTRLAFPASRPGALETYLVDNLTPWATYYFGIRAVDAFNIFGSLDVQTQAGAPVRAKPLNLAPATPSGLQATAGRNRVNLAWADLPASGKGLDFEAYRLYRSTLPASNYAVVFASASVARLDRPLTPFVTYYYRLSAVDHEGLESALSTATLAMPFTLPPQEAFGFKVAQNATTVTLGWGRTTRFADAELFDDPQNPLIDELIGYQVQRSTDVCAAFSMLAVKAPGETQHVDFTGGGSYYYQVRSFNSIGLSTNAVILDIFGRQIYKVDDCLSRAVVENDLTTILSKSSNTWGEDILLKAERKPEETGGKVLQTVEFVPLLGGAREVKGFHFSRPVKIQLHFVTEGGVPVPQTPQFSVKEAFNQQGTYSPKASVKAAGDSKDLGIFWHNGIEYKKLYGKVDSVAQTVTAETPNVGKFQIRQVFRDSAVTFDISNITSRVFSPNGDGLNDVVIFLFDNPRASFVEGKIYDVRGAFVADMKAGPQPDSLMWDGKMNGRAVTSGVYLYEIRAEGKTFNGTVVVAR